MDAIALAVDVSVRLNAAGAQRLAEAGVSAVLGYLGDRTHPQWGKTLTPEVVAAIAGAGLAIGSIWESAPTSAAYFSAAQGAKDAAYAVANAQALGQPEGTIIWHTVDYDAQPADFPRIAEHFTAIRKAQVGYKVGGYGHADVVAYLLQQGLIDAGWTTYAWRRRCAEGSVLYQYRNGAVVAGLTCDLDAVLAEDAGFWSPAGPVRTTAQPWPAWAPLPALGASTPAGGGGTVPALRRGDRGPAVEAMQALLAAAGFSPGEVDGAFGPATEAALRAFQQAKALAVDGICGPQTWHALAVAAAEAPNRVRREIVARLQQVLETV